MCWIFPTWLEWIMFLLQWGKTSCLYFECSDSSVSQCINSDFICINLFNWLSQRAEVFAEGWLHQSAYKMSVGGKCCLDVTVEITWKLGLVGTVLESSTNIWWKFTESLTVAEKTFDFIPKHEMTLAFFVWLHCAVAFSCKDLFINSFCWWGVY